MGEQPSLFEQPALAAANLEDALTTRNAAYREVRAEEASAARTDPLHLGRRQRRVYELLTRHTDLTNSEIALMLGWPINCVTPRTMELRKKDLVVKGRRRACTVTGNVVQAWRVARQAARVSANPCVRAYGYGPEGATCATCTRLYGKRYGRIYYKCALRRDTAGPKSDHRKSWPACGKYEPTSGAEAPGDDT